MYHQHQENQQIQQHQQQQQQDGSSNADGGTAASSASASHLDHALLESLFYNEMVMLESSAGLPGATSSSPPCLPTEHDTPHTIVEKEILRDFGVGGGTTLFTSTATAPPDAAGYSQNINTSNYTTTAVLPPTVSSQQQQQQTIQHHDLQQQQQQQSNPLHHQAPPSLTIPQFASNLNTTFVPTGGKSNTSTSATATMVRQQQSQSRPQSQLGMVCMDPQATATAAAAAAAMLSRRSSNGIKIQSTTAIPIITSPNTTLKVASLVIAPSSTITAATGPAPAPLPNYLPPNRIEAAAPNISTTTDGVVQKSQGLGGNISGVQVPQDRARQLVDQFATLASRLGIDLPDSVLQSLTSAAAKNDPTLSLNQQQQETKGITPTTTIVATNSVVATIKDENTQEKLDSSNNNNTALSAMAPTVMELRKTAEEAIASVTQPNKDQTSSTTTCLDEKRKEVSSEEASSPAVAALTNYNNNNTSNDNKPTYSKRRKKPRLSDCETKLAQLKAENEQLKRHLQNVSNKAHKFDKEKEEAGKHIAQLMHDPNAGPREMELSVRKFSDMYSDYGINRQQELSFHLEQLQRLVNPTNFTKMGLWTLGQSNQGTKKNPIAGILVKELDITPQQGRKILDQSEKIRNLCDNLKEAHALLVKLKSLCEKKTRCFQDRMSKCTEILTSKQVVKLIIWINEHTQQLENVCPGWGTEHIHSKK